MMEEDLRDDIKEIENRSGDIWRSCGDRLGARGQRPRRDYSRRSWRPARASRFCGSSFGSYDARAIELLRARLPQGA
jgi:hypothetical protein